MTEECKLCGGVGRVVILVPNVAPEKGKVYSDCPCCIERIWTADEAKLNARIAELEAQQAVLVDALEDYVVNDAAPVELNTILQKAIAALAAVKTAARKTCAAGGFMFGNDDACWFYCVGGGCGSDEPCEHQQPAGQEVSDEESKSTTCRSC